MTDTPHPVDVHVGRVLREQREQRGLNQTDLGLALGVTFQQVQKYEKGTNRVSASRLHAAAQTLGLPIQAFFDGIDDGTVTEKAMIHTPAGRRLARAVETLEPRQLASVAALIETMARPA